MDPVTGKDKTEPWLTKPEVARKLRVSVRTVERLRLPCTRVGGQNRYRMSEVERAVADGDDEKRDRWHSPDCPVVRNAHLPSEQPCTCSLLVADGGEGKPRLFVHECSQCGHGVPCQHRSEAAALRSQLENAVADRDAHRHLSEKNEARLSSAESEVARLREALERIAYPPLDAQGTPIDTPGDAEGIARAALGGG